MRRPARTALISLMLASTVVLAGILVTGLRSIPVRTYSVRVPDSGTAGIARPSHRLCESPIRTPRPASAVGVFADPAAGAPSIEVDVFASGRRIGFGRRTPDPRVREQLVSLDHTIPAHQPLRVCIRASSGALTVWGAGAQAPGVVADGVAPGMQFALVLTRPATFLGSLGTAFSRASLFKLSWVGSWTFWLLLVLLAFTFPLAGRALVRALNEDEADENRDARKDSP
jgi:hypothetical protein